MRRSNVRAREAIADRYRMKRRELFLFLSAAMIAPRFVSAQRRGTSRVGVLDPNPGPRQSTLAAIHEGLEDAGFSSFGLVSIEYRCADWTDSRFNPLITLAIDLVVCGVDVIVTATFSGIQAVKAATSSIPIVSIGDGNVITAGLIEAALAGGLFDAVVRARSSHTKLIDTIFWTRLALGMTACLCCMAAAIALAAVVAPLAFGDALARLKPERLEAVHKAIAELRTQRQEVARPGPFKDFRANLHVHSLYSHDSRGTLDDIVASAKAAKTRSGDFAKLRSITNVL